MKALLREIRASANMSQQELADYMGVTFATINRWENGHATPNRMAQMKLYDFCVEHQIPLIDFVLSKIKSAASSVELADGEILLYHGSKSGIEGKIAPISRERCDFGRGFYMGTQPEQPLTLICDFDKPMFYVMSIALDGLKTIRIPPDIQWAMLVAYHRGKMEEIRGSALYARYQNMLADCDVVIGSIADDRMFYVLDNFFLGNITDVALVNSLSALQLGEQVVCITQKGCDKVKIEKEIPLSYMERKSLQAESEQNRAKGISLAHEICKNYRREGRYFDELLEEMEG